MTIRRPEWWNAPIEYTFWQAVRECLEMTKGNRLRHRAHVIWVQVGRPSRKARRNFSWCECCCWLCNKNEEDWP